jgi:hypothetical protein
MKAPSYMLTLTLGLGVALAQPPQTTPPQSTPPQNTQPQTAPQSTMPQSTTPAAPQTDTKSDTKTTAASGSQTGASAEMKTTTFKGVLVDLGCGSQSSSGAASATASTASASSSDASKAAEASNAAGSNSANRSSSDSSCPVTANSTQLGMKLEDGRTVRFDLVGNQRAQDALKNDKKWSKDLSSNKEIHAKVSGVLNGDKLIVSSIH